MLSATDQVVWEGIHQHAYDWAYELVLLDRISSDDAEFYAGWVASAYWECPEYVNHPRTFVEYCEAVGFDPYSLKAEASC